MESWSFSSPGQSPAPGRSPGRAIVLPPALALAGSAAAPALTKSLTLKFFM